MRVPTAGSPRRRCRVGSPPCLPLGGAVRPLQDELLKGHRDLLEDRRPLADPPLPKEPSRRIPRCRRALEPPPPLDGRHQGDPDRQALAW